MADRRTESTLFGLDDTNVDDIQKDMANIYYKEVVGRNEFEARQREQVMRLRMYEAGNLQDRLERDAIFQSSCPVPRIKLEIEKDLQWNTPTKKFRELSLDDPDDIFHEIAKMKEEKEC